MVRVEVNQVVNPARKDRETVRVSQLCNLNGYLTTAKCPPRVISTVIDLFGVWIHPAFNNAVRKYHLANLHREVEEK